MWYWLSINIYQFSFNLVKKYNIGDKNIIKGTYIQTG
jgi:hypothetical protein